MRDLQQTEEAPTEGEVEGEEIELVGEAGEEEEGEEGEDEEVIEVVIKEISLYITLKTNPKEDIEGEGVELLLEVGRRHRRYLTRNLSRINEKD